MTTLVNVRDWPTLDHTDTNPSSTVNTSNGAGSNSIAIGYQPQGTNSVAIGGPTVGMTFDSIPKSHAYYCNDSVQVFIELPGIDVSTLEMFQIEKNGETTFKLTVKRTNKHINERCNQDFVGGTFERSYEYNRNLTRDGIDTSVVVKPSYRDGVLHISFSREQRYVRKVTAITLAE
jgi:HSP20 family molecular chaperone IbpA